MLDDLLNVGHESYGDDISVMSEELPGEILTGAVEAHQTRT